MFRPVEVLDRLADELGIPRGRGRQVALAGRLGKKPSAVKQWFERDSIGDREVLELCAREGISADWLYRDIGPRRVSVDMPDSPAVPLPPEPEDDESMLHQDMRSVVVEVASVVEIQRMIETVMVAVERIGRDARTIHERVSDLVDTARETAGEN